MSGAGWPRMHVLQGERVVAEYVRLVLGEKDAGTPGFLDSGRAESTNGTLASW